MPQPKNTPSVSSLKNRVIVLLMASILILPQPKVATVGPGIRYFAVFSVHQDDFPEIARRYNLLIWHNHPDLVSGLPILRAANPELKALMYREFFCVQKIETPLTETVGNYEWILEHHPDWFQKDTSGQMVEIPNYPGRFMMDPAHPEWQDFWITETLPVIIKNGWDGVFADDVLTNVKAHNLPPLRNYPDNRSLQEAFYGFLKKAHAAFQKENKLFIANVSNSYDYDGLLEQWLGVTDGILEEHFSGDALNWGTHVGNRQIQAMQTAARTGKWYLALTYGNWNDKTKRDLSLASYLAGTTGDQIFWLYRPHDNFSEEFPSEPKWAQDLGTPKDSGHRVGETWSREFENGTLLVNPSSRRQSLTWREKSYTLPARSFQIIP